MDDTGALQVDNESNAIDTARTHASPQSLWPADTNLVFASGSNRVMMMQQHPLIHVIIQDGIENLRANLLFERGFPDMHSSVVYTKHSLLTAARSHYPGASFIHRHLLNDEEYIGHLTPLVCFWVLTMIFTDAINSCVLGFHFSGVKSKSGAALWSCQSSWPWTRLKSYKMSTSNYLIITTHSRQ